MRRSSRGGLRVASALALLAPCLQAHDSGVGAAPTLSAGAAFLGHDLTLAVTGAPPDADVRLYVAPAAGATSTPFGTLELARDQLTLLASGQADPSGAWTFDHAIPLDPALAEAPAHYQALVTDDSLPAGAKLTDAVHLRYLGPRSYTLCSGRRDYWMSAGGRGRLVVHSVVGGNQAFALDAGSRVGVGWISTWPGTWQPVFSADLARAAAVLDTRTVAVFDNFDGHLLAKLTVERGSPRLLPSADGRHAYALDRADTGLPARLHAIDLETVSLVGTLDLPLPSPGLWVLDEASGHAFVAQLDAASGRASLQRVDLESLQLLEALPLGDVRTTTVRFLLGEGGWLYAGTQGLNTGSDAGRFVAIDSSSPGTPTHVALFPYQLVTGAVVVPASGLVLVGARYPSIPGSGNLYAAPLQQPAALTQVRVPMDWFVLGPSVVRDQTLWVLAPACPGCPAPFDDGEPAHLWRLETSAFSWWKHPTEWWHGPPVTLRAARGPLADTLILPRDGARLAFTPLEPQVTTLDPVSGAAGDTWELEWGALEAFVLDVP